MAYSKKKQPLQDVAYQKLEQDVKAGNIGKAYLFYGVETFLRDYWLRQLKKELVPPAFETFNYRRMEGQGLRMSDLEEAVNAAPMMAERVLTVVVDLDIMKLKEQEQTRMIRLLEDLPETCCLVFVYDTILYDPDQRRKLYKALAANVQIVEFRLQENRQLVLWIAGHFKALGKKIDRRTAEYLLFFCGNLMTNLSHEIDKIAACASGPVITRQDIETVAEPVTEAVIFDLTNALTAGNYALAAEKMDLLLRQRESPHGLVSMMGRELFRIYTARLALDTGRDQSWLIRQWKMRSPYPARLLMDAARRSSPAWCSRSVCMCQELDYRLKSERGIDAEGELKLLLVRLGEGR